MSIGIYIITNNISNTIYVGQTVNSVRRWYRHKCDLNKQKHHCIHLQRAWNKYGSIAFTFILIEELSLGKNNEQNIKILTETEQFWVDYFTYIGCSLYNECKISGSRLGHSPSQETKDKIRLAQLGKPKPHKGVPRSAESRKKTGDGNRGRACLESTKQKLKEVHTGNTYSLGFKHSSETRRKMSEGQKLRQQQLREQKQSN